MGEKGLQDITSRLPSGYHIDKNGVGLLDGPRPSLRIVWDEEKGVWLPPGFVHDPGDPSRAFNQISGRDAVWDEDGHRWIDAKSGEPISYEQ